MSPEDERDALEEMAIAVISLAIHISDDEKVREKLLPQLPPYTQQLLHGVVLTANRFRAEEPAAWIKPASKRLSKRMLDSMQEVVEEELARLRKTRGEAS